MPAFIPTADLMDDHDGELQQCALPLRWFGRLRGFHGAVTTVSCFEDNGLVRAALAEPGKGRVLVVDGAGSLRRALVGDQMAALAQQNGWEGIVIHGAIRDGDALDGMDVAVLALGRAPRKSSREGRGGRDLPLSFGEVTFTPGAWLYADHDGVVLAAAPLHG